MYPGVSPTVSDWLTSGAFAGGYGVDLFLVLSAYLITELLQREYQARGFIDIKAFYLRRILRIWPLYFTFLAIAAIFPFILPDQKFGIEYLAAFSGRELDLQLSWISGIDRRASVSVSLEEQF